MAKIVILFICGLLPGILSQCNVQRAQPLLKRAAYEFATELSKRIALEKDNHFVASTFSAWTLLATASLGAEDATLAEFQKVLRLHKQPCFNDRFFELIKSIGSDGNVTIERSSTIFIAKGLRISNVFQRKVKRAGVSSIEVLPFEDSEYVANMISNYVSRATHNTISDLVSPSDLEGIYVVMIDALFFKGIWQTPFPYEYTEVQPFYDDEGTSIGEVNMMSVVGMFNVSTVSQIDATVLELPFGTDGRYAMLFFLPRYNTTLPAVIDSLTKVSLTTIYAIFARDFMQMVSVQIPRFKITSELDNLKELLFDMGLVQAFDAQSAQFPFLSDEQLYISNVIQKANVEVTEEGAEASAASGATFAARSGPEVFRLNKPFFYMILDTATQVPLFTGAYSNPSLY